LVPFSRPSRWLPAARKPLLRLLPRPLRLPMPLRPLRLLMPLRPLRLLMPLLRLLLLRLLRRLKRRSNPGNGIVSAKPVQAGPGLPGFSIWRS